jgi:hypothetical protein
MTSSPTDAQTDAFDSPWKDILDGWFADFMAFFFPDAASEIDWSQGMIVREQLEERFGPLPATVLARLEAADAEQLRAWARRLLDAGSLDDVLGDAD